MELNDTTIRLMADYFTKVGSVGAESYKVLQAYDRFLDQTLITKTASAQVVQETALELAEKVGSIRLHDGRALLEGYAMKKEAADNFSDPDKSLRFMGVILDVLQEDRAKSSVKTASLEPGRPWDGTGAGTGSELTALQELARENGVKF